MRKITCSVLLFLFLAPAVPAASCKAGEENARVVVQCSRSSAFVNVNINSCRKIGKVLIEVLDTKGTVLYREEGKALTPELIRRLDKGGFPRGPLTVHVTTKDFHLAQDFTVE
jgi:hypothetical protein